ncbi:MAG: 2Fe-2S iron-sulfur cluster binding domain-containing protein [Geminicoccaceae bacterium]|nr:2Fe-2S iron-sulfur cluster binding domain-containing protein [Geminicoccaceae bacterium]
MAKIVVVDRDGNESEIEGTIGWSVMEVIRDANLPIEAACGGCCACATCHVYVDPAWLAKLDEPDADEELMLDEAFEVQDNSRLSCQIKLSDELDGIRVTLAPEF